MRGELGKEIPAVALTGFGMEDDVRRTMHAGFDDHLTKPVNLARLEATIQRAYKSQGSRSSRNAHSLRLTHEREPACPSSPTTPPA